MKCKDDVVKIMKQAREYLIIEKAANLRVRITKAWECGARA